MRDPARNRPLRSVATAAVALSVALLAASDAGAAWYDIGWTFRQRIVVLSTLADSTLTGFPVLLSLSAPAAPLFAGAQADGDDVLFTDADGTTKLAHEIESYDAPTGTIVAWIRLPAVPASGDTAIYLYYGNPSAPPQEQPSAVWDADYEAVWHLHDDFDDSTVNAHAGTNTGSTSAAGQVADGQSFDGGNDWIDLAGGCYLGNAFTAEAWIRPNSPQGKDRVFLFGDLSCASRQGTMAWATTPGRIEVLTTTNGSAGPPAATSGAVADGVWSQVVWTFDGTTSTLWVDGAPSAGASSGNTLSVSGVNYLGTKGAGNFWNGDIDEPRVSRIARPGPWIVASYRTQRTPSAYLVFGVEEALPRSLVKRAFEADGTPIPSGTTVPAGTLVKFLLYFENPYGVAADVSVRDVLAPGFAYVPGSMRVDATLAASVVCPGGTCDESAIFARVDGAGLAVGDGDASTPPTDADVASYDVPSATLDFGDGNNAGNARLDVPADRIWAAVLSVRMQ